MRNSTWPLAIRYFTHRLTPTEIESFFARLRNQAGLQSITGPVVGIAAHPHDDLILATALSAGAPFLVTGDKQFLARGSYRSTRLVSPRQFLAILDDESSH